VVVDDVEVVVEVEVVEVEVVLEGAVDAVVVDTGGPVTVVVGTGRITGTPGATGGGIGNVQTAAAQSVGVVAITT